MATGDLARKIAAIAEEPGSLLFAGAGCSALLKIKVWKGYLEDLALVAEKYEPPIAALMRSRLNQNQFLEAATLFRRFLQAPPSEIFKAICQPFAVGTYTVEPLLPLASLPFGGIVTTNYDSSLFDARATIAVERSQSRLGMAVPRESPPQILRKHEAKGAAYIPTPFVLYLHGQASLPVQAESMVFDQKDYDELYADARYTEGLLQLFSMRRCMFLGFSFADPGLDQVLKTWTALKGPTFPQAHIAVLPESGIALRPRLTSMNVEVLTYDDSSGSHDILWRAIADAAHLASAVARPSSKPGRPVSVRPAPLSAVRDLLAICYASASMGTRIRPLRRIVLEGVALAIITKNISGGLGQEQLLRGMAQTLGMPLNELAPEMPAILEHLTESGACRVDGEQISSTQKVPDTLSVQTRLLAEHVARRIKLREGVVLTEPARISLAQAFEDLLMSRAWDLAAHFVQPRLGSLHLINDAVEGVLRTIKWPSYLKVETVRRGMIDLLVRPEEKEADILADLGRVAFAVQLALGNARSTFAYTEALPQRLYLDASVLMPAIVTGHPLYNVYWPVLARLRKSARDVGGEVSIVAPTEFLNEIISHRRNAVLAVANSKLENSGNLEREVLLYGAENLNVFIGSYATHVHRAKRPISFATFLKQYAPYETEAQLARFLTTKNIEVEKLEADGPRPTEMWDWFNALDTEFQREKDNPKPKVLIEHDAWQFLRLEKDHKRGIRSMFVTADGRLRRAVSAIKGGMLADSLLTGSSLVKLVDLLLGVSVDHRGLARLLWGVHSIDLGGAVRRYFTDKGLQKRGEIETMVLPTVVDTIVQDAEAAPDFSTLDFMSEDTTDRAKVTDFFDRFENRFYEYLEDAVKRREAQEARAQAQASGEGGRHSEKKKGKQKRTPRTKR